MEKLAILLVSLAPSLVWLSYATIKAKADWRNEALWSAFAMGGVAVVAIAGPVGIVAAMGGGPGTGAESALLGSGALPAIGRALLTAALPEEALKFLALILIAERHVDVRRKQDLVPIAVAVALGFAALENFFYIAFAQNWQGVAAGRSLTAVPGHGLYGAIMGAWLTLARLAPDRRRSRLFAAWAMPVLAHAAYNAPLEAARAGMSIGHLAIWLVVLLTVGTLAVRLCNRALAAAAGADRVIGREGTALAGAVVVPIGLAMLLSGLPLSALLVRMMHLPWTALWVAVPFCVFPMILGCDLLLWNRRQASAA